MPVKSKKQFRYIQWLRHKKNKSKKDAWANDPEWTDVNYKELPQAAENFITKFENFINEKNKDK